MNQKGFELLKVLEGCSLKAYKLEGEKYFTIGYGYSFDESITEDTVWTQKHAEEMLMKSVGKYEDYVHIHAGRYGFNFNENQISALTSYCYNRGEGGIIELLGVSKTIEEVSENIVEYWGRSYRYKNALIERRKKEKILFDTKVNSDTKVNIVKHTTKVSKSDIVKSMQNALNLSYDSKLAVDGKIGMKTLKVLKSTFVKNRTENEYAKWIQSRLKERGYCIKVDGIFGDESEKMLKSFQRNNKIKVDGICGYYTVTRLV